MPGSGKSYIGKKLAKDLGYKLIELDKIMEENFKLPLQQILDKIGERAFLEEQEKDAILCTSYTDTENSLVVSPGGSIVYSEKAMRHLKKVSKIIYLKISLDVVKKRIAETPRGIVGIKEKTLEQLYKERTLLYEKWADVILDAEREASEIIEDIRKQIR